MVRPQMDAVGSEHPGYGMFARCLNVVCPEAGTTKTNSRFAFPLIGLLVALLLVAACAASQAPPESYPTVLAALPSIQPQPTAEPTVPATAPATATQEVYPTADPTTAPATATPETEDAESCVIVPEKYCSDGEIIYTKTRTGLPDMYIGFNLPANVPIVTNIPGQTLKGKINQPNAFEGSILRIMDPNLSNTTSPTLEIKGDIKFEDMISRNVKEGTVVVYTQDTGVKNFGKYNVLIALRQLDTQLGYPVSMEKILRKLFPKVFTKPTQYFDYSGPEQPAPTVLSPLFGKQ